MQKLGDRGERIAEAALTRKGYQLLHRNYRCPHGEIDRIMQDEETIIFVEVKTRRGAEAGVPAEAVTSHKRRQITRTALYYLQQKDLTDSPCRFDVVEVIFSPPTPRARHLPGVFEAEFRVD